MTKIVKFGWYVCENMRFSFFNRLMFVQSIKYLNSVCGQIRDTHRVKIIKFDRGVPGKLINVWHTYIHTYVHTHINDRYIHADLWTTISNNSSLRAFDKVYACFAVFGKGISVYILRSRNLQAFEHSRSFVSFAAVFYHSKSIWKFA